MTHEELTIRAIEKTLPSVVSIIIGKDEKAVRQSIPDQLWQRLEQEAKDQNKQISRDEFVRDMPRTKEGLVKVGFGSGFFVSKNGLILTNKHVVTDADAEYTVITATDDRYQAEVLARDPINDVAILKIDGDGGFPAIALGDSDNVKLGESVIALGNALGEFQNSVSAGIISGLARALTAISEDAQHAEHLRGLFQTDAAINPGNSGGPLVNLHGEVVGINAAVVFGAENIGFAIPVNRAKKDLADVAKFGRIRKLFLGIRYVPAPNELKQKLKLAEDGAILVKAEAIPGREAVVSDSPAEKAGIEEGDVIVSVNDRALGDHNALEDVLENSKIGDIVKLKLIRLKTGSMEVSVKLTERK